MRKAMFTFLNTLLVLNLISQASNYCDCKMAIPVCNHNQIVIDQLHGPGKNEIIINNCDANVTPESNSVWFKFEIEHNGTLSFDLTPLNTGDDLDFVLFKEPKNDFCNLSESVRCIFSGKNLGDLVRSDKNCQGMTGLNDVSNDHQEYRGCFGFDDNYAQSVTATAGQVYLLMVNNYSGNHGFTFEYTGTAQLKSFTKSRDLVVTKSLPGLGNTIQFEINPEIRSNYQSYTTTLEMNDTLLTFQGVGPHVVTIQNSNSVRMDVTVESHFGCFNTQSFTLEISDDRQQIKNEYITFAHPFPNPTQGNISIPYYAPNPLFGNIQIFDVNGRIIQRFKAALSGLDLIKIDFTNYSHGVYFIEISKTSEDNIRLGQFQIEVLN